MSSETISGEQTEPKTAWLKVIVTGFAEGAPARLGFYFVLILPNGARKRCGQVARVTDERLIQRLRAEVKPGDEIRVATATDNNVPECPTVLLDFCPV